MNSLDICLRLRQTRLLLINVNSLSIEVCKNLCLAGVAGITIFDNTCVTARDIDEKYIEQFDYVCLFNCYDFSTISRLNKLCRQQECVDENGKKQVSFFWAGSFGLYGFVFKDLGDIYEYLSENSIGTESLIKGEGGNESKKSEKTTTKSVRNFITFEKAFSTEWKPNRRQASIRSAVNTYNLLRG